MFSTLTPRYFQFRLFRTWLTLVHFSAKLFASLRPATVPAILDPHLFHHWNVKARLAALFAPPHYLGLPYAKEEIRVLLNHLAHRISLVTLAVERSLPHPGTLFQPILLVGRELMYLTLRHTAIFLGAYEQLEIVVRTDNRPKQIITTGKGKRTIIFGNGHLQTNRKTLYVTIPDDELFHEHLVIHYSRLHGWQIKKMEGEFGCGFQYSPDSLNDSIPLTETDCAIMRIGHTSILINSDGGGLTPKR